MKRVWAVAALSCLASTLLAAEGAMTRVLECEGDDATMEVYVPQAAVSGLGVKNVQLAQPVVGAYALDLSDAGKGKSLEPVRVSVAPDAKTVTIDQYTRGLPPTQVPVEGGTVDFDNRFGTNAKCGPFNGED
jgi:hypothetical protein